MFYGKSTAPTSIVPKSVSLGRQIGAGKPVLKPTSTVTLSVGNPQALGKLGSTVLVRAERAIKALLRGEKPNNRPLQALNKVLGVDIGASAAKQGVKGAIVTVSAALPGVSRVKLTEAQVAGLKTYKMHIAAVLGKISTTSTSTAAAPVSVPPANEGEAVRQSLLASRPARSVAKPIFQRGSALEAATASTVAATIPSVAQAQSGPEAAAALTVADSGNGGVVATATGAARGLFQRPLLLGGIVIGGIALFALSRR